MYFYIFKDHAGEWRWSFRAANHKTMADSGEGYKELAGCVHAIRTFKNAVASAPAHDYSQNPPAYIPT